MSTQGIALEITQSPFIRTFQGTENAALAPRGCTLYVAASRKARSGAKLLHACKTIRDVFNAEGTIPVSVVLYDHGLPEMKGTELVESIRKAQKLDRVVLYCQKEVSRWTKAERSAFHEALEATIEFLAELAPEGPDDSAAQVCEVDSSLQLARERRAQLLSAEKWLDAPAVHAQQGGKLDSQGINNTASRLRRRAELLGAWNGREFLHPAFQFQPNTGLLMPEVKALLEILPKDRTGWRQTMWLFQGHGLLKGERPADMFQKNPEGVLKAARSDFTISDERW